MKKYPYFPGCTLKQTAKNFERSALAAARRLDIELVELPRWNCCGAVFSLTADDVMHHIGAVRDLIRVEQMNEAGLVDGEYRLVTLCSMCYNVLKRVSLLVKDADTLAKANAFMDEEPDYQGKVEVVHFLEILRDELGFEALAERVSRPLEGLKVSAYYGCTLLRPREVSIDDPEAPRIMDQFIEALGATPVDNPYKSLCCGSYHTVGSGKEIVATRAHKIIEGARRGGADLIITSCPLCAFNLDNRQELVREMYPDFEHMPILYFTQLLALALGAEDEAGFSDNYVDPRPLLRRLSLLSQPVS